MYKNVAGQKIAVFAWDVAADAEKTGDAANITAQISKDGGATAATTNSASELDATDAPGIYLFEPTQAESNADLVVLFAKSSTANVKIDPVVIHTVAATVESASDQRYDIIVEGSTSADVIMFIDLVDSAGDPVTAKTYSDVSSCRMMRDGDGTLSDSVSVTAGSLGSHGLSDTNATLVLVDDTYAPGRYQLTLPNDLCLTGAQRAWLRLAVTGCETVMVQAEIVVTMSMDTSGRANLGQVLDQAVALSVGNRLKVDVDSISDDQPAAVNLEKALDGTGYGFPACTIPTVTTVGTVTTLTDHTPQSGDTYGALPTNFSDLEIEVTTGRVDVGSWAGTAVTLSLHDKPDVNVNEWKDFNLSDHDYLGLAETAISSLQDQIGTAGDGLTAIPEVALVTTVTTVGTVTTNTDMRGTDSAATAASLATHDGKLDTVDSNVDTINSSIGIDGAGLTAIPEVALVATVTTNTDMRGTDSAATAAALTTHDGKLDTAQIDLDTLTGTTSTDGLDGDPPETATQQIMVSYLYKTFRNDVDQSSDTWSLYNSAGDAVDHQATVSQVGDVVTKTQVVAGP